MSKYKYILLGMLIGIFIPCTAVFAQSQIKLIVNGKEIQSDVPAQVINGRTMVPAKALAEALGATVSWNAQENAVTITSNSVSNASSDKIVEPVKLSDSSVKTVSPVKSETIQENGSQIVTINSIQYVNIDSAMVKKLKGKGYAFISDITYTHCNFVGEHESVIATLTRGPGVYNGYVLKSEFDKYIAPILNQ